jgi:hypothetical protein
MNIEVEVPVYVVTIAEGKDSIPGRAPKEEFVAVVSTVESAMSRAAMHLGYSALADVTGKQVKMGEDFWSIPIITGQRAIWIRKVWL